MKTRSHFFRLVLCAAVPFFTAPVRLSAQNTASPADGTLNTGDVVEVRVMRHDADLGGKFTVGSDGAIELQLIGRVKLQGLTPDQASQRITALLADGWLRKPQVTVNMVEFAKSLITVDGQVNRPNAFSVARNRTLTLSQAIGMAGGFNTRANAKAVILKRGTKSYTFNVKDIYENPEKDIRLKDGDVVFVKASLL